MPPRFSFLVAARGCSQGARVGSYALLSVLAYQAAGTGLAIAVVLLAWYATAVLVSPTAGACADRYDRRRTLLLTDAVAAVLLFALPLSPGLLGLVLAALALSAAEAFVSPTITSWVADLVDDEQLPRANARVSAAASTGYAVGPALVGVGLLSSSWVAVGTLASLHVLTCAFVLAGPKDVRGVDGARAATPRVRRMRIRELVDEPVWPLCLVMGAVMGSYGLMIAAELPLARLFTDDAIGYTLLVSAWGVGSLVGSLLAGRRASTWRALVIGVSGCAIGFAVAGAAPHLAVAVVAMGAGAVMDAGATVVATTRLQRSVEAERRGRVIGAYDSFTWACFAAGVPLGGALVDLIGVRALYGVCAVVCVSGLLAQRQMSAERSFRA